MRAQVVLVLAYLLASRALELAWSRRNLGLLAPQNPRVVPRDGLAGIVCVHALWFIGMAAEERFLGPAYAVPLGQWACAVLFAASELVRFWCIHALGPRWSVRVVVVPGSALVRRGPYRWMRHPNYVAVLVGLLALPLALGLPHAALWTAPLAAFVTRVRIGIEQAALDRTERT